MTPKSYLRRSAMAVALKSRHPILEKRLPMQIADFLSHLQGVQPSGKGFAALCPAHLDGNPSLSISTGDDSRILLHCHAGCTVIQILDAIGLVEKNLFEEAETPKQKRKVVATYDYQDASGQILFQVVRTDPKGFFQRRPDDNGGWINSLGDVRRVLYQLPELIARQEEIVFIVEGEKDVETLQPLGFLATTNAGGAGKWCKEYSDVLKGRDVVIVPDRDAPGQKHGKQVAWMLFQAARSIKVIDLSGPEKDVSDWIKAGHTKKEFLALVSAAPKLEQVQDPGEVEEPENEDDREEGDEDLDGDADDLVKPCLKKSKSQADQLVEIAEKSNLELFHTPEDEPFATIQLSDHKENWTLKSRAIRRWLCQAFYQEFEKAPSSQAIQDAMGVLEGKAIYKGAQIPVFTRIAGDEKAVYLDLVNPLWESIEIMPHGWRTVSDSPVRFRRAKGSSPLPTPERGGSILQLKSFVNLSTEDDWVLLVSWILGALFPQGPYPVLVLGGSHGSAKSTTARVARRLIDPNSADIRALPRNEHDLVIAAANAWAQVFDNVSSLADWMSDALCRLATGGGFSTRELYTDSDEIVFDAQRPVLLNGIEEFVTRGDLLDRSILLSLARIQDEKRRPETEYWAAFRTAQPRILGALLDILSQALRNLPTTRLTMAPRMADFARLMAAAEPALGWEPGTFFRAYTNNQASGNDAVLEASPLASLILEMAQKEELPLRGSATMILAAITAKATEAMKKMKGWPNHPRSLTNALRRIQANMVDAGVEILFGDRESDSSTRTRLITIRKCLFSSVRSVRSVRPPMEDPRTEGEPNRTQPEPNNAAADVGFTLIQREVNPTNPTNPTKQTFSGPPPTVDDPQEIVQVVL